MEDLWEKGSLLEKQEPLLLLAGRVKWKKKDREKLFMRRTDQLFSTSSGLRCLHCWIWIIFLDRNSSKDIDQICFGFFKSPLHLSKQFSYVTRSDDLTGQIRSSLVLQLGKTTRHLSQQLRKRHSCYRTFRESIAEYGPVYGAKGSALRGGDRVWGWVWWSQSLQGYHDLGTLYWLLNLKFNLSCDLEVSWQHIR